MQWITLAESVEWVVGDQIVITATDLYEPNCNWDPAAWNYCGTTKNSTSEIRTIQGFDTATNRIAVSPPLDSFHYGDSRTYDYMKPDGTVIQQYTVKTVAQVGLLTRNIIFSGEMVKENTMDP